MQEAIWKNHNGIVTPDDTVYFLGDLTMESPSCRQKLDPLLSKLNGELIMILGNHDRIMPYTLVEMGFSSVHTSLVIEIEGKKIFLCHDPAVVQPGNIPSDIDLVLCGHVHTLWRKIDIPVATIINVGVDVWEFKPVSYQQILELIN
jgi:calcineurin-like phosphoesterase family protein